MPFRAQLRVAVEEGLLLGVKWALAVGLTLVGLSYALNDYGLVRQRAQNGQAAFEYLQQQVAAQQKAQGKETP